ncbi:MAG TPA: ATP-binding protein [Thermodesulfobacteriota bacterium]|nr:ATP-binding protein [Thermodesulfobacteriota bacterium]
MNSKSRATRMTLKREKHNLEDLSILTEAMSCFNGAASRLESSYHHLEERVRQLDAEVKKKNYELNETLRQKEEMQEYLHAILESLPIGVVAVNLKGSITTLNRAAENLIGVSAEDSVGKSLNEILSGQCSESDNVEMQRVDDTEEVGPREMEIVRGGKRVTVLVSEACLEKSGRKRTGTLVTIQDITHVKRLEKQAVRNSRLAAMGEMAAKMAHDIRNPLGSIELFVSVLKRELMAHEEPCKLLEHISSGVKSINSIVSSVLMFMRPQQKALFKRIDIHQPLNDSVFFSSHLVQGNDGVQVSVCGCEYPLFVNGDGELLKQVFLNLILNAIQAMPSRGTLKITAEEGHRNGSDERCAVIRFVDTGMGIPKEHINKIFDPFFTTKTRGTGLGLSIVHSIIKSHGGTIDIESTQGAGTEFVISLPLCGEQRHHGAQ